MGLNLGLLITMGTVSIGGRIIEIILTKLNKTEEANMVGIVSTSMLVTTVVTAVLSVMSSVKTLSGK